MFYAEKAWKNVQEILIFLIFFFFGGDITAEKELNILLLIL